MDIYANRDRLIAPKEYYIDGVERTGDCGSSKVQDLVIPDSFYGCSIVEACKIHDYMYEVGDTIEYKRLADRVFYWNMMILVRRYSKCPFTNFFRFMPPIIRSIQTLFAPAESNLDLKVCLHSWGVCSIPSSFMIEFQIS